ncbi:MAG: hypothetical protein ACLFR2_02295 [Candidatus Kapaibacterium sp.]
MKQKTKRRRTVEIYFVLYLAALIFILPGEKDKTDISADEDKPEFLIYPEKTTLNCFLEIDSLGPKILTVDSINNIFHRGGVSNLNYEFIIEDQALKQKLVLASESRTNTNHFRIEEKPKLNTVSFFWYPPVYELKNKSFIVHVNADGEYTSKDGRTIPVEASTKFSLNIIFLDQQETPGQDDQYLAIRDTNEQTEPDVPRMFIMRDEPGEVLLDPVENPVRTIAYQKWTNPVLIFGLNPEKDLLRKPVVSIKNNPENNGGTASIENFSTNQIVLRGESPGFGESRVTLTLIRKADGMEKSVEFRVTPQPLKSPEFARIMYPGKTYEIRPNLPKLANRGIKAQLVEKQSGDVRAQNSTGGSFNFTPSINDTGKVLYLELYADNNLIGQKYTIQVNNYPQPEVIDIQPVGNSSAYIRTRAFGLYGNKANYITKIELVDGNARFIEKPGDGREDRESLVWMQVFQAVPKDTDKPFRFKMKAIDRQGRATLIKSYPSD